MSGGPEVRCPEVRRSDVQGPEVNPEDVPSNYDAFTSGCLGMSEWLGRVNRVGTRSAPKQKKDEESKDLSAIHPIQPLENPITDKTGHPCLARA